MLHEQAAVQLAACCDSGFDEAFCTLPTVFTQISKQQSLSGYLQHMAEETFTVPSNTEQLQLENNQLKQTCVSVWFSNKSNTEVLMLLAGWVLAFFTLLLSTIRINEVGKAVGCAQQGQAFDSILFI